MTLVLPFQAIGLLEGLPISIKDQFDQKDADCTMGLAVNTFSPKEEDGLLLKMLRDEGAIPFVRTNVPQLLMLPEVTILNITSPLFLIALLYNLTSIPFHLSLVN